MNANGTQTIQAFVDANNTINESNENNNKRSIFVTVVKKLPDMVIDKIIFSPPSVTAGGAANITVVVRNNGTANIPSSYSVNVTLTNKNKGVVVRVFSFKLLPVGSTKQFVVAYKTSPKDNTTQQFEAFVDSSNIVVESNENNNKKTGSLQVSVPPNAPTGRFFWVSRMFRRDEHVT